jgi:hypothetical protein
MSPFDSATAPGQDHFPRKNNTKKSCTLCPGIRCTLCSEFSCTLYSEILISEISCADGLRVVILPWVARSQKLLHIYWFFVRDRLPRAIYVYPLRGWDAERIL